MAPRETEDNAYAKFRGDKQRALWYVMVFSGVVNPENRVISVTYSVVQNYGHNIKLDRKDLPG